MKNKGYCIKVVLKYLILTLVPTILNYLGSRISPLSIWQENGFIGENVDVVRIQNNCVIISIVLYALFLSIPLVTTNAKYHNILTQRKKLLKFNKDILVESLAKRLELEYIHLNIRIFVPKKNIINIVKKFLNLKYELHYTIKNIDVLADEDNTNGLTLMVYPESQGLVGDCVREEAVVYDDDLKNTNSNKYRLSKSMINKTSNLKFSLCCPVFKEKSVIAVVAFDSTHEIKLENLEDTEKNQFRTAIRTFTQRLYDNVPELFISVWR